MGKPMCSESPEEVPNVAGKEGAVGGERGTASGGLPRGPRTKCNLLALASEARLKR